MSYADLPCSPDDSKRVLASSPIATAEACSCGVVHLHMGAISLRFTESSLHMLQRVITDACCELLVAGEASGEALSLRRGVPGVARGMA